VTVDLPTLDEATGWSGFEAWAVAMRDELPAAALAEALDRLPEELIDRVCGPRWLPVRGLPAPFGCPGCGARQDFARKDKRTRPRRFDTAAGVGSVRLWHLGCRGSGKVSAPLLVMLGLSGRRRCWPASTPSGRRARSRWCGWTAPGCAPGRAGWAATATSRSA
jgi:hypothetical protein